MRNWRRKSRLDRVDCGRPGHRLRASSSQGQKQAVYEVVELRFQILEPKATPAIHSPILWLKKKQTKNHQNKY